MLKAFYPHGYAESVFSIDYHKLYQRGYRGLIFDIDQTLVPHGYDSTAEIDTLFQKIHSVGLKTLFLSNNDEERVTSFLKNIDSLYICDAQKPDTTSFLKAIQMLGVKKEEALVIGDQIFTDILGSNKCGIASVLVAYVCPKDEDLTKIGIRRNLEKVILKCYGMSRSCHNRIGDIYSGETF